MRDMASVLPDLTTGEIEKLLSGLTAGQELGCVKGYTFHFTGAPAAATAMTSVIRAM